MPSDLAPLWPLDPSITFLNHGSFGSCPRSVLASQRELRDRLEAQPIQFLARDLNGLLGSAREALGAFVGADPDDLAFVTNATGAVNAVLRSLHFRPGDEILTDDHEYNAILNIVRHVATGQGARVVVARIPFPVHAEDDVVDAFLGAVTERTRLAVLSHVTSPTALVFPVRRIVAELAARGVETFVDGAHAPGMVPLDIDAVGAAWYTGNLHKWVCAPKGAGFLHARRDRQDGVRPTTISHGANAILGERGATTRYRAEFDWQGTLDPTAWLAVPDALTTVGGLVDGGWPAVMARNHALAMTTRSVLTAALGLESEVPAPESMLGSMVACPLPGDGPLATAGAGSSPLDTDPLQQRLLDEFRIEVPIYPFPVPAAESPDPPRRLIRVSSALHNGPDDAERLAAALRAIAGTGVAAGAPGRS
jgi:isopenicillin-N epimerase